MDDSRQTGQRSQVNYYAFLLRLWRESPGGPWRVMLQDAATGERRGFAGLITAVRFLWEKMGASADSESELTLPATSDREEADQS